MLNIGNAVLKQVLLKNNIKYKLVLFLGEYVKNLFDRIAVVLFESSIIRFLYSNHQDCETDISKFKKDYVFIKKI